MSKALLVTGALLLAPAPAAPPPAQDVRSGAGQAFTDDPGSRAARFVEALDDFRRGADADVAADALRAAAAEMSARDGREDALAVARHYLTLEAAERAEGLALEARYLGLRDRWVAWDDAAEEERPGWDTFVAELAPALERLSGDAARAGDASPGARVDALLARLELRDVAQRPGAGDTERAARLGRAEDLARRSERRFAAAGFVTPRLEPLWLVGRLARARGADAEAADAFQRCADLAARVGRPLWRERGLLGLLALARDAGDPFAARRRIEELATFRDPRTSWALAREHAADLLHRDRARDALGFLRAHPPSGADGQDPMAEDEWFGLLVAAHLRTGDLEAARAAAAELALADGEHAVLARASLALASGEPEAAVAVLDASRSQEEPQPWSAAGETLAAVLRGEAALALGDADAAARALRGALGRARRWELGRAAGAGAAAGSVLGEWAGIHAVALLARAELERGDPRAAFVAAVDWQGRGLRPARSRVSATDLAQEAARESLGLTAWVVGADFTVALHLDGTGRATGEVVPLGRRELERAVRRFRQAVLADDEERALEVGFELARALLPPALRESLARRERLGGEGLALLAHGTLERVPFAALPCADGRAPSTRRLGDLGRLRVLPGYPAPDCAAQLPSDGRAKWNLAGDPLDADGCSRLPGAARELAELQQLVPVERVVGARSLTADALAALLGGDAPLHVATHLVALQGETSTVNAPAVGLECSGGEVLSAAEITARSPRLPLVVLAACATGDGEVLDGEGALGLARTFLAAGTRGAVVTLWPVADGPAREFSLALHAELRRGAPAAAACARARRALRAAGHPPTEWAAYRFAGRD